MWAASDFLGRTERARGDLTRITIEDAIVDVGERLPTEKLVALLADATRMRLVTLRRVTSTIDSRRRVRARKLFKEVLGDLGGIESTLEYIYRRDVERAQGLPVGRRNRSVSIGTRTDVEYHEYGVLVELDGRRGHQDAGSAFRDMGRGDGLRPRNGVPEGEESKRPSATAARRTSGLSESRTPRASSIPGAVMESAMSRFQSQLARR